jgi:hypothetical protein
LLFFSCVSFFCLCAHTEAVSSEGGSLSYLQSDSSIRARTHARTSYFIPSSILYCKCSLARVILILHLFASVRGPCPVMYPQDLDQYQHSNISAA